ncbi:MAG: hypothetical protein NTU97_04185 [Candidatus Magasanikbacteria bacterium]|nr:hypothetical protein [Candidatus Magasanikbacteria bacterium]
MGNFNRDDRHGGGGGRSFGGGGRSFGGGGRSFGGGGRDGGRPEMHKATCGKCGKECEVPFRPTGERPVFCSDCFREQGQGRGERSDRFERPSRSNFGDEQKQRIGGSQSIEQFKGQFDMLSTKLDKILKALTPATTVAAAPEVAKEVVEVKSKKTKAVEAKIKSSLKKVAAKKKK